MLALEIEGDRYAFHKPTGDDVLSTVPTSRCESDFLESEAREDLRDNMLELAMIELEQRTRLSHQFLNDRQRNRAGLNQHRLSSRRELPGSKDLCWRQDHAVGLNNLTQVLRAAVGACFLEHIRGYLRSAHAEREEHPIRLAARGLRNNASILALCLKASAPVHLMYYPAQMRGAQTIIATVAGMLALWACTPPAQEPAEPDPGEEIVTTPSGGEGFVVECVKPSDCVRQAGDRCPRGYTWQPLGQSGATTTRSSEKGGAFVIASGDTATAVGRQNTETTSETAQQFMVECKEYSASPATGLGRPCETVENCGRLRVALRKAELGDYVVCAPNLDGEKQCTFACNVPDDAETTERLEKLCDGFKRQCAAPGEDPAEKNCLD